MRKCIATTATLVSKAVCHPGRTSKVDVRLPGKRNSYSHVARPARLIITCLLRRLQGITPPTLPLSYSLTLPLLLSPTLPLARSPTLPFHEVGGTLRRLSQVKVIDSQYAQWKDLATEDAW